MRLPCFLLQQRPSPADGSLILENVPHALYLHVPFCPKVCPYCDFHKMHRNESLVAAYLDRLEQEALALHDAFPTRLDTVYFGGGTPSHLSDAELARVVSVFEKTWGWPAAETTLEADPLTFNKARLETFKTLGFNRLSVGLQSTQDEVLKFLGRLHDGTQGLRAVDMALAAGFEVSADLITGVFNQDAGRDLHALAQTGVPHVSVYSLTVEPYTPFALRGVTVDEDKEADDYALAHEILSHYGLERYEVSSHAKPGHESQHNQVYWRGEYFLNLGPSAAGFVPAQDDALTGERRTNGPIKAWLEGAAPETLPVTPQDFVLDVLMTGLRTRRGADVGALAERTGIDVLEKYRTLVDDLTGRGSLEVDGCYLRATERGLLQLNGVLKRFFAQS